MNFASSAAVQMLQAPLLIHLVESNEGVCGKKIQGRHEWKRRREEGCNQKEVEKEISSRARAGTIKSTQDNNCDEMCQTFVLFVECNVFVSLTHSLTHSVPLV